MQEFERDPRNPYSVQSYFYELNKHGMYLTVVRLYQKHNLSTLNADLSAGIKVQYEIARDNVASFSI